LLSHDPMLWPRVADAARRAHPKGRSCSPGSSWLVSRRTDPQPRAQPSRSEGTAGPSGGQHRNDGPHVGEGVPRIPPSDPRASWFRGSSSNAAASACCRRRARLSIAMQRPASGSLTSPVACASFPHSPAIMARAADRRDSRVRAGPARGGVSTGATQPGRVESRVAGDRCSRGSLEGIRCSPPRSAVVA
jgi:hypothetical protein